MKSTRSEQKYARRPGLRARFAVKTGIVSLFLSVRSWLLMVFSLPIPSRDEILSSPVQEHGPHHGATSSYTATQSHGGARPPSPIMDDPSEELERELASTHLGNQRR